VVLGHEHLFDLFRMLSGSPKPGQNRVLFVPLHPRQAADANAFGDERPGLNDLLFGRPATIEDHLFGLGEGLLAGSCMGIADGLAWFCRPS